MTLSTLQSRAVIAVYPTHALAEQAIHDLSAAGYEMTGLSILGQYLPNQESVVGYYNLGARMTRWVDEQPFWGGAFGLLFGTGLFMVPGIGPVFMAGPLLAWTLAILEGAIVIAGLSAIGAALYNVGIPKDSILQYERDLRAGKFLLVAHGPPREVLKAKAILDSNARDFNVTLPTLAVAAAHL